MNRQRETERAAQRRRTFRRTTAPIDPRNRLVILLVSFVVIGAAFVAVLVDLQTVRPQRYRELGEDQRTRVNKITGPRGDIVDRNGFVLAASTPSHQIVADPSSVADPGATAAVLAPILGLDQGTLAGALARTSDTDNYRLLARHVSDATVDQLQQVKAAQSRGDKSLVGIFVRPDEDRVYPAGPLARAVVGDVNTADGAGTFGIEKVYNEAMTGQPGTERIERGRFGSISVGDWTVNPAAPGANVTLTIDYRIQYMAEQILQENCEKQDAKGASAVVSDPRTGEILALADVTRAKDGTCAVTDYNGGLVYPFEPGSVIKPLIVAAATEEKGLTADTKINVPGRVTIGGKTFIDHPPHTEAMFPVSEIIAQSMNVGAIQISRQLAPDTIYRYLSNFGLGQPTGLPVPGEGKGSLRKPSAWQGADFASIPIGQGLAVNTVQLLGAYNVLANGGMFVAPTLVRPLGSTDGALHSDTVTPPRRVVSRRAADEVTRSLVQVVQHGTGTRAAIAGYTVAGKTGTAWKAYRDESGRNTYGEDGARRYVASFAGFVPAENPELSILIVMDEPVNQYMAAEAAAPAFSQLGAYAVRILGIAPTQVSPADGARVRAVAAVGPTTTTAASEGTGLARTAEPSTTATTAPATTTPPSVTAGAPATQGSTTTVKGGSTATTAKAGSTTTTAKAGSTTTVARGGTTTTPKATAAKATTTTRAGTKP